MVTDGNFKDDDSECAKTTVSDNPYVELDLGKDTLIYAVAFVLPGSQESYSKIKIRVSSKSNMLYKSPSRASPFRKMATKIMFAQLERMLRLFTNPFHKFSRTIY